MKIYVVLHTAMHGDFADDGQDTEVVFATTDESRAKAFVEKTNSQWAATNKKNKFPHQWWEVNETNLLEISDI